MVNQWFVCKVSDFNPLVTLLLGCDNTLSKLEDNIISLTLHSGKYHYN
jgi:hypothetical protein